MTNAEARCNKSLRPRKPEGSLGRTAQDVHLDSHTAPELCATLNQPFCFYSRNDVCFTMARGSASCVRPKQCDVIADCRGREERGKAKRSVYYRALQKRRKKEKRKKVCSRWEECCLFFVFVLGCCWAFCLFSVLVCVCGGGGGGGVVAVCLLVLGLFWGVLVCLLFFHFLVILPQTYQCWSLFIQHASVMHPLRYNTFAHSFIPLCVMVFLLYSIHIAQW